jgi:hypothetical protein
MRAKFGAIVVDGRGKIGGHVASKNRSGSYFRTKVSPSNPQTNSQTLARGRMTSNAQGWGGLSDAQRSAWNSAVSDFKGTNVFGDSVNPSGFNLYCRININRAIAGQAALDTPPLPAGVPYLSTFGVAAVSATGVVTITYAPALAVGESMVLEATPSMSPGKSFVKNQFRVIDILTSADASPAAVTAAYAAKFGAPGEVGQKIHLRAKIIDNATGLVGAVVQTTAVIS